MSVLQVLSIHRPHTDREHERIRVLTVVEGLAALLVLVTFVGGLAGAITYGVVWLIRSHLG